MMLAPSCEVDVLPAQKNLSQLWLSEKETETNAIARGDKGKESELKNCIESAQCKSPSHIAHISMQFTQSSDPARRTLESGTHEAASCMCCQVRHPS